eukprot:gnl/TRDRNA2_/TRDRNA2_51224_c0_seq1.p1 gnl/TRDRNA2_/TRDRNA2_51224_c0~~gnl/TRDRNA2_/TRDRNA2_51224_c0_seq1.p1  ORF type:complete len:229 (-),score=28.35 gnl/TRDRNA2_/TRDRNA2_51224_c0_seq1:65-751(-)
MAFDFRSAAGISYADGTQMTPAWDSIGYKVVAKVGQRYFSVWAGESAEYVMSLESRDDASPNHRGGLYVCRSLEAAARHRIPVRTGGLFVAPRVVLRCACAGPYVEYVGGKIACSALTPLEELPLPTGYLHNAPGRPVEQPLPARPLTPADLRPRLRPRSALGRRSTPPTPADAVGGALQRRPSTAGVPTTPAARRASSPGSAMRRETLALEEEVAEMERRLSQFGRR